ncbi:hypothetical protein [Lactiplantibacillus fabifermentans]|uniref:Uncharacterized protein n=2 Tax=Lactiplantibacillus fabifermentans TaxID=483011 RepID=A0A0R2NUQ1_9LACO|nr:hypothetical protein [Lactiplantibacillus fabifermentans]ETY73877.1 hypothetical protein LFAB_10255 [Lactiplantibacillus fabifermentans T30PCM01]KRO27587.1 hypothetical protein DY78_GL003105 [Lactiplantibacillus fabifermentans DSM 21115]
MDLHDEIINSPYMQPIIAGPNYQRSRELAIALMEVDMSPEQFVTATDWSKEMVTDALAGQPKVEVAVYAALMQTIADQKWAPQRD